MEFVTLGNALLAIGGAAAVVVLLGLLASVVEVLKQKYGSQVSTEQLYHLKELAEAAIIAAEKEYGEFKPVIQAVAPDAVVVLDKVEAKVNEEKDLFNQNKKEFAMDLIRPLVPEKYQDFIGAVVEQALDGYNRYSKKAVTSVTKDLD